MTKIRIDGRELLVKKTTRTMIAWQQQSGLDISKMTSSDAGIYGTAIAAFVALHNAGFEPSWDEILDRDLDEFEMLEEPGDNRDQETDVQDPPSSLADSAPVAAAGEATAAKEG